MPDLVTLWEKTDDGVWPVKLHAVDAMHALEVDPDRWSTSKPEPPPPPVEPEPEYQEDEE